MSRIKIISVGILLAALTACGSSSSGGSTPANGTTTRATSPATSPSSGFDKTAARATAQKALLTLDDLPSGWTSTPASDSDEADDAAVQNQLASCLGVPASLFSDKGPNKAEADSGDFTSPNDGATGSVSEDVDVETSDVIAAEFNVVKSDKLPGCLASVFGDFLKKKFANDPQTAAAKIGKVTATRDDLPTYGDESVGVAIKIPFTVASTNAEIDLDMVFIRSGNLTAQVLFQNTFKPFDAALETNVLRKAADKLSAAAG